jgi:pimeloyl-ACP methyl ester carboxylesterase/tellurite resistance protein
MGWDVDMNEHFSQNITDLLTMPDLSGHFDRNAFMTPAADIGKTLSHLNGTQEYLQDLAHLAADQVATLGQSVTGRSKTVASAFQASAATFRSPDAVGQLSEYLVDFTQRWVIFVDALRRRGNQFVRHEQEGCPPVLAYDYEVIVDGATLPRPVNYSLVRIVPPKGVTTKDDSRPYIIIDPRAGHGSGIGGFKSESEVGVALASGHPTYFCIFSTHPTPSQTLADVCRAEAHFVREVRHRHPQAPKPVIIGNCQGGWAAMMLTATNPDLTGPVVVNGSPLSYWAGMRGKNPMRYLGGLAGGAVPALLLADLGNGEFDGANLVQNFENLNPANTYWKKYYDLFVKGEDEVAHYLEFERWWSGFYFMNESEIRWVVENLFVGNKVAHGEANLDNRLHVDFRNIRAPIIVFASHGDNITPPAQALNWITDLYSNVHEIKARGQRIVYTVHDSIGHLGIFVSSSVANKQHKEISSTLQTIEALEPGLYEMSIVDVSGEGLARTYEVEFHERSIEDLAHFGDTRAEERPFAAVARLSEINSEFYKLAVRPVVRSMVSPASAKALFDTNPLRLRRYFFSDRNPAICGFGALAQAVLDNRRKVSPGNPFLQAERAFSNGMIAFWDNYRDVRDSMCEFWCNAVYGSPMMQALVPSDNLRVSETPGTDLRVIPNVHNALENIDNGGFADAVIRMLILMAHSRSAVRRDRLERSNQVLTTSEPFASLGLRTRNGIIHRQSLIVDFEPDQALATLPLLLPDPEDRQRAMDICKDIAGPESEMDERTVALLDRLSEVLDLAEKKAPAKKPARTPASN